MLKIKTFVFNPFQVNTYVLHDESGEAVVIDAACHDMAEFNKVKKYLEENNLKLVKLLTTHYHIDHILGNHFFESNFGVLPLAHAKGSFFFNRLKSDAAFYGLNLDKVVIPQTFIEDGDSIQFGNSELEVIYLPGHADGSVCFLSKSDHCLFAGDVIFNGSIGRTDLPTGDFDALSDGIINRIYTLPENTVIYSGHGIPTSVKEEKYGNPYVNVKDI